MVSSLIIAVKPHRVCDLVEIERSLWYDYTGTRIDLLEYSARSNPAHLATRSLEEKVDKKLTRIVDGFEQAAKIKTPSKCESLGLSSLRSAGPLPLYSGSDIEVRPQVFQSTTLQNMPGSALTKVDLQGCTRRSVVQTEQGDDQ